MVFHVLVRLSDLFLRMYIKINKEFPLIFTISHLVFLGVATQSDQHLHMRDMGVLWINPGPLI